MARVSKEAKAANHAKIVKEASKLFRRQGVEITSVADIMKAAGFTHGGFYRHFSSKDELVSVAISCAMDDITGSIEVAISQKDASKAVADFVDQYLSPKHVANPESGCPIAALGAEASHAALDNEAQSYQQDLANGSHRLVDLLAQGLTGDPTEAKTRAIGLLATMIGTVIMARTAKSKAEMLKILEAGRLAAKRLM